MTVGEKIADSSDEFNQACEHIVGLLKDSSFLLQADSAATASFLAITALEEVAKVHLGMYRQSAVLVARRKDPLFRHDEKHRIGAAPTVAMGSRLKKAIGEDWLHELLEVARSGGLVQLREAALYLKQKGKKLQAPRDAVSHSAGRELLLWAIEAFDDALVGYTDHSFVLGKVTDELFGKWDSA